MNKNKLKLLRKENEKRMASAMGISKAQAISNYDPHVRIKLKKDERMSLHQGKYQKTTVIRRPDADLAGKHGSVFMDKIK